MKCHHPIHRILDSERGHLLLTLVIAVAVSMILLTVAAQSWSTVLQREKEEELIFRGWEYAIALKNFRKDRGRLPTDLKELTERGQRHQRYLRKLYRDPLSPDGEWNLLYLSPDGKGLINPNAPPIEGQLPAGLQERGMPLQRMPQGLQTSGGKIAGLQIAGVVSKSAEKAFKQYRKKEYYNEWLFSIFDLLEYQQQQEKDQKNVGGRPRHW
ncbi:MAG: type II secretion system protein [Acidobacteriota bacterium]